MHYYQDPSTALRMTKVMANEELLIWSLASTSRKEILRGLSLTLAAQDDSGVKSSQESSKPCLSFHHKNLNTQKPNGLNPFG